LRGRSARRRAGEEAKCSNEEKLGAWRVSNKDNENVTTEPTSTYEVRRGEPLRLDTWIELANRI
jgi:hypothetical protein